MANLHIGNGCKKHKKEDLWFKDHFHYPIDRIFAGIGDKAKFKGECILDVGCGDGIMDLAIALKRSANFMVGLDVNEGWKNLPAVAYENLGLKNLPSNLRFVRGDASCLPFRTASFDLIFSWSSFEHIPDYSTAFSELNRVLKKGGYLFIQIHPLYFSAFGSHLDRFVQIPFAHLSYSNEEFKKIYFESTAKINPHQIDQLFKQSKDDAAFKKYLWTEYQRLNKITISDLQEGLLSLGFTVKKMELSTQNSIDFSIDKSGKLSKIPFHDLVIDGIELLLQKNGDTGPPLYKRRENNHIHNQFTVNVPEYVKKYQNIGYWEYLLREALNNAKIKDLREKTILVLSSCAGNTTLPLLKIFNNSTIITTDLSAELLYLLKDHLKNFDAKNNRYNLIQCDIHELNGIFKNNSLDIVVGGAFLHYLYDPQKLLKQCYYTLNEEGIAIFFEPFENGNMLLSLLYQLILSQNELEKEKLPDSVINILKQIVNDFKILSNNDKTRDIFEILDDKWLFKRNYFENISKDIGFKSCKIESLTTDFKKYFEKQSLTHLRLAIGFEYDKLPLWSREIIKLADITFSEEMKKDLLTEGCIILKK